LGFRVSRAQHDAKHENVQAEKGGG